MKIDKSIILLGLGLVFSVAVWLVITQIVPKPAAPGGRGPLISGHFELTDHTGKRVSDADYRGKYLLVYFGNTHCPEICPTSLQSLSDAMELLGKQANEIVPLFITVDPERDTVERMASYVANFDERTVGLTGSADEIKAAIKAYRIYSKKVVSDDAIDFDHSALTFFMDRKGAYLTHFAYGVSGEQMAKKIQQLMSMKGPEKISKAQQRGEPGAPVR